MLYSGTLCRQARLHSNAGGLCPQPAGATLAAFLEQSNAVIGHDALAQLRKITAPTQITFGAMDQATSTRFADPLKSNIRGSELLIFEGCSHAPIYEKVDEFNQKTLQFLERHTSSRAAAN